MKFISARSALSAGVVTVASVALLAAPGAALAKTEACKGTNTKGQGSSLQAEAQAVWVPGFEGTGKGECGGKPKIEEYKTTSSGKGYAAWESKHEYGTYGFIGSDNTVNAAEKTIIEGQAVGKTSEMLTIPVLQGAVAIVVNMPTGCTAESTIAKGRLALDQSTLEGIYAGKITKWNELGKVEGAGNTLTGGASCEVPIIPVVREDGSGTTHIFKKFLNLTDSKTSFEYEAGKSATWSELAEGSLSTKWPLVANVTKATSSGGPGLLKTVAATPGSIGYANLADARNSANGGFTGQSPSRFWVELESSSKAGGKGVKRKYQDPATNGDEAKSGEANCKKTAFSNGVGSFPPPKATAAWNEVTASGQSKTYALCGLTYDFALTDYEAYASFGATAEEAATVKEYLGYEVAKKGGAAAIIGHDYAPLPKALVTIADEGISSIS